MSERIGFIGAGKMAEALIRGILRSGQAPPENIIASDISRPRLEALHGALGIETTQSNKDVLARANVVFLAVYPQHAEGVLAEVGGLFRDDHLVVSIMAGVPTAAIEAQIAAAARVVRVMPNVACLVGEAASGVAAGAHATPADQERVIRLLSSVGTAIGVNESLMDAVTGLSGSGPAYAFTVIEALADGGVAEGLPRDVAIKLAAQTLLGAGKMVLETGEHPAILRERVTSPAGTTAEGLAVLEEKGVRSAFAQAVRAAARRSRRLGEGK